MKNCKDILRISSFLLALSAAGMASAVTGPNMVANGGFEDGLSGWTEVNPGGKYGAVDYQGRYLDNPCAGLAVARVDGCGAHNYGLSTLTGRYLEGAKEKGLDVSNTEGVYQTITGLTPGDTYTLRFFTTATDFIWQGENQYWKVTFGTETQNGNIFGPMARDTGGYYYKFKANWDDTGATNEDILRNQRWIATNLTFVAASETQRLTFRQAESLDSPWNAHTTTVPYGTPAILLLDGVTLTNDNYTPPPVPEPSTAAMGVIGLTFIGFLLSRRRRPG